jgi:hypothetical protein
VPAAEDLWVGENPAVALSRGGRCGAKLLYQSFKLFLLAGCELITDLLACVLSARG